MYITYVILAITGFIVSAIAVDDLSGTKSPDAGSRQAPGYSRSGAESAVPTYTGVR